MNLLSLRYFLKVAEYSSLTKAALILNISQPSLTQHLKHLEDHFGMPLVARHGRGIILTEPGKLLCLRGETLLDQIDGLRSELECSASLPRGTLTVGMPQSWSETVTYPVIERFRKEYPDVRIKLAVNPSEVLAAAMNNNEIQLAILTATDDTSQFWSTPIVEDSVFLVGPSSSGLNECAPVMVKDLINYPLILPLNQTLLLRRLDRALAEAGLALNTVMETASANILPLVARGAGFCAISASGLPLVGPGAPFAAVQVIDMSVTWVIATPKNRPKTAAVSAFEGLLAEQIAASVSSGRWRAARFLAQPDGTAQRTDARDNLRL